MNIFAPIDLSLFPKEREERLKEIYRYSIFETMFYRSHLWDHQQRVSWLVEEIGTALAPHMHVDVERARTIALVHDDAEIEMGDVQAGHKAQMTKEQLAALDNQEEEAIEKLAAQYPKELNGYVYKDLLMDACKKDSVEAQLSEYADKLDAYCECLHELLAGNTPLLTGYTLYTRYFAQEKKVPLLIDAFNKAAPHPLIRPFIYTPPPETPVSWRDYKKFTGKPHTAESIRITTEKYPFYDAWRNIVLEKGGAEGVRYLLTQREFLPT